MDTMVLEAARHMTKLARMASAGERARDPECAVSVQREAAFRAVNMHAVELNEDIAKVFIDLALANPTLGGEIFLAGAKAYRKIHEPARVPDKVLDSAYSVLVALSVLPDTKMAETAWEAYRETCEQFKAVAYADAESTITAMRAANKARKANGEDVADADSDDSDDTATK